MAKGLKIAAPPRRRSENALPKPAEKTNFSGTSNFARISEAEKVQFNKRVTRGVADGYEMLAIKTRKKVPELLAEALDLLEEEYGKV